MKFPPRVSLAQLPTPLQPLRRLQQAQGGPLIWLKRDDLTGTALSGNKVRKLEFIAAKALDEGYGALVTCGGTQSNHCRATALVAAQLGLECHLILRDDGKARSQSDQPLEMAGNRLLDFLAGAEVSIHSPSEYFSKQSELFEKVMAAYQSKGVKALAIPTGGSDATGVWGYFSACEELKQDFKSHKLDPQAIVHATGSGGTQAGLTAGAEHYELACPVYGINVCDNEAWFLKKVRGDLDNWAEKYFKPKESQWITDLSINVIDGYVGEGYGRINDEVIKTIHWLGRTEAVLLDPVYTGKAFAGLLSEINRGRFNSAQDIVFVHTGGIFGLFPYASSLYNRAPD